MKLAQEVANLEWSSLLKLLLAQSVSLGVWHRPGTEEMLIGCLLKEGPNEVQK